LSDTSTKLPEPVSLTTSKEEVTTNEPGATNLQSQHDVAFKWKLAFGVCLAVIILLLAGKLGQLYSGRGDTIIASANWMLLIRAGSRCDANTSLALFTDV